MINIELTKIERDHSDINPYRITKEIESFAVVPEYFFENLQKMKEKHAAPYEMLERTFPQDSQSRLKNALSKMVAPSSSSRRRNALRPCGSEKNKQTAAQKTPHVGEWNDDLHKAINNRTNYMQRINILSK